MPYRRPALALAVALTFLASQFANAQSKTLRSKPARSGSQAAVPAPEVQGAEPVMLPSPAADVAVSPVSGTLAVLDADSTQLVLYTKRSVEKVLDDGPGSGKAVTVGAGPVAVEHKRVGDECYFLVLSAGDKTIRVISDPAGKEVGSIPISLGQCMSLAAPTSPTVPYAYYASPSQPGLGRVNLATLKDEGLIDTTSARGGGGDAYDIAVSADGRYVYARRPHTSPAGFMAFEVEPAPADATKKQQPPRAPQVTYQHDTRPMYVPEALGQWVASGNKLYTPDLKDAVGSLPDGSTPLCALASRPVFFAAKDNELTAYSANTLRPLAGVTVSPATKESDAPNRRSGRRDSRESGLSVGGWRVVADEKNSALVLWSGSSIQSLPLAAFKLPAEPFLFADVTGPTELSVGQAWSAKVTPRDDHTSLKLADAPDGMKLSGTTLQWTPGAADVGPVNVKLQLSAGADSGKPIERPQTLALVVRRAGVTLPFDPTLVTMSPDGATVAAVMSVPANGIDRVRRARSGRGGRGGADAPDGPYTRVVLLNTSDGKIRADREFAFSTSSAAIGGGVVVLGMSDSDAVMALSSKDLADVKRVFVPSRPWRVAIAGDTLFVANSGGGAPENPTTRFTLPDIEPVDEPRGGGYKVNFYFDRGSLPVREREGWFYRGVVYDDAMKKPLLVMSLDDVVALPSEQMNIGGVQDFSNSAPVMPWGVRVMGTNLQRVTGQNVGQAQGAAGMTILPDVPAAVVISREEVRDEKNDGLSPPRERFVLSVMDVVTGTLGKSRIVLSDEVIKPRYNDGGGRDGAVSVYAAPGVVLARVYERVFVLKTSELDAKSLAQPLVIAAKQPAFVAQKGGGPLKLTYDVSGGEAPLKFALRGEMPGVSLDAKTGAVTVDPDALQSRAVDALVQFLRNRSGNFQRPGEPAPDPLAKYKEAAGKRWELLSGKPPAGVPVAVPVQLVARDVQQQTATLNHYVLIEVSDAAVKSKLAENAQVAMPTRRGGGPTTQPTDDAAVRELRQRVADLERRNAELEGQVKLLKELVGGKK